MDKKDLTLQHTVLYSQQCNTIHKLTMTFHYFNQLSQKPEIFMGPQAAASVHKIDEVIGYLDALKQRYQELREAVSDVRNT